MSGALKAAKASSYRPGAGMIVRGDPGLWGRIKRGVKGAAVGFLTGGPAGAVAGGAAGALGGGGPPPPPGMAAAQGPRGLAQPGPIALPGFPAGPGKRATGTAVVPRAGMGVMATGTTVACPPGYRPNKSSYYTSAGFVEKGTKCVKIRRRNSLNPRALSRAISRVDGAKRIQSTLSEISTKRYTKGGKRRDY